jgi:hypothetical protein
MQLRSMAWAGLKRRKSRFGFMLAALVSGSDCRRARLALARHAHGSERRARPLRRQYRYHAEGACGGSAYGAVALER